MKLKDWFNTRYNSLADQVARERLEAKKLEKYKTFHEKFDRSLNSYHRNRTNRQDSMVPNDAIELLP